MADLRGNIEDIEIDTENCIYDSPCQHHVMITTKDWKIKNKLLKGNVIYQILQDLKKEIPEHFQEYKNFTD